MTVMFASIYIIPISKSLLILYDRLFHAGTIIEWVYKL
jgi:hypothetical protein